MPLSPERRVAIAFIRGFRINLDDTLKPIFIPTQYAEAQAAGAIKFFFGDAVPPPAKLSDEMKQIFADMNAELLTYMKESYDDLLPATVEQTLDQIEAYLKISFTSSELEELAVLAENPLLRKLFEVSPVFSILRQEKNSLYKSMNERIDEYVRRPETKDSIQNAVQQFIKKAKLDEQDTDSGSVDPDNIF